MKKYYRLQLEYQEWANLQFAEHLILHNTHTSKSIKLISHVANAHHAWNFRIKGSESPYAIWQIHKPDHLQDVIKLAAQASLEILKEQRVEEVITYTNSKGESLENQIWEIFTHINAHSNYHRGQIAADLREHLIDPPYTDYIYYRRSVVNQ